jgi:hypothetical protein
VWQLRLAEMTEEERKQPSLEVRQYVMRCIEHGVSARTAECTLKAKTKTELDGCDL